MSPPSEDPERTPTPPPSEADAAGAHTLPPSLDRTATFRPSPNAGHPETHLPTGSTSLPGYEILEPLGHGGMGVVYRARQLKLNRLVAIKVLSAGSHASADELARFRTEAQAVARLKHPNIVQIHDVGEHQGLPYLCLEHVDGGSLCDRFDGRPWRTRDAAALVAVLAQALDVAHRHGIVHRDLKPANVLITAEGLPKIADFGIAKQLGETSEHTRTGAILGTPGYMAPEQAFGQSKDAGPAADVFSLGALLYQAISSIQPFRGSSVFDTIRRTIEQEPDRPTTHNSLVDRDLETICLKCLEKRPERRYTTAGLLAEDLQRYLSGEPIRARRAGHGEKLVRWVSRHRLASAAVGFLLFGQLLTLVNLYASQRSPMFRAIIGFGPNWLSPFWLPIVFLVALALGALVWWLTRLARCSRVERWGVYIVVALIVAYAILQLGW